MNSFLPKALPSPSLSRQTQTEGVSVENIRASLPKETPFLWLDSRSGGEHHLLLGRCWEIHRYPQRWSLVIGEQTLPIPESPSLSQTLNYLQGEWLPEQPDGTELGFLFSYEAGWEWEDRRHPKETDPDLPLWSIFCPEEVITLTAEGRYTHLHGQQPSFILNPKTETPPMAFAKDVVISSSYGREDHIRKVHSIKQHIRQGDSFQVNLSQTFVGKGQVDALEWAKFAIPREGGGFSALWNSTDYQVMSLSPERLLRIEGKRLITRPIAGTLPRHPEETPEALQAFVDHPKELAEHNMLIDLERNDLGKVSIPGSVSITEKLTVETLPHVHHLVSQVEGTLKENTGYGDALSAVFPGGTITGCPKLETMHLLDTHEEEPRGPYTGSLGYLSKDVLDSNILIRSALIKDHEVTMRFGGGIVWDSDPEKEYLETIAKSRGIVQSLLEGGATVDPDHRSLRQFFS